MADRRLDVAKWANRLRGAHTSKAKVGGKLHELLRRAYSYPEGAKLNQLSEGKYAGVVQKALCMGLLEQFKRCDGHTTYFISNIGVVGMHNLNELVDKKRGKFITIMVNPSDEWINHAQRVLW